MNIITQALDMLALKLTDYKHRWTKQERKLYESAIKKAGQIEPKIAEVFYYYIDTDGRNQLANISTVEAGKMLTELYTKLENFRKATRDLYESNFSE